MSRGGGVLFAIKNTINTHEINSIAIQSRTLIAIESNHVIVVTYLPPNCNTSQLDQTITYLKQFSDRKIILTAW